MAPNGHPSAEAGSTTGSAAKAGGSCMRTTCACPGTRRGIAAEAARWLLDLDLDREGDEETAHRVLEGGSLSGRTALPKAATRGTAHAVARACRRWS